MRRLFFVKLILTVFTGLGLAGAGIRFAFGLGASSNLSNAVPWGLWIGFDDMAGVALASGGFVITAIVYIFHLKKYNSILRSAILTAFLGYCLVPFSLLLDIGLPWNIWHPLIYWQYHSILFAVSLCVMLFSTVLAIGFAITVLEHPLFAVPLLQRAYQFIKRYILVIVIIGIVISTLHQSALGSLFLIMPHRVHPLWYSPIIYVLYFISAIGLGCSMMIFESTVTSYLYRHKAEKDLLQGLGRASSIVILLYALVRCVDLGVRHKLTIAFDGTWQSNLFLVEMAVSAILPILIFNVRRLRTNPAWLFAGSSLVVAGFILNRLCISFITISKPGNAAYFPSSIELFTSLGLISGGILIFLYCVEHLDLFEGKFLFRPVNNVTFTFFSRPGLEGQLRALDQMSLFTMAFILSVALGVAGFYQNAAFDRKYHSVRTGKASALPDGATLRINNGNELMFVDFNHKGHQDTLGKKESCTKCHHMNVRKNEISPCYTCHSDMYKESSIFNHRKHELLYRDSGSCRTCHPQERTALSFRPCKDCHPAMFPDKLAVDGLKFVDPAYMDAMHRSCIACHTIEFPKRGKPTPDYCNTCHKNMESDIWKKKYGNMVPVHGTPGADSSVAQDFSNKSMH
jgi:Ni/Fe-hydrogenase subunit HybB-like protein